MRYLILFPLLLLSSLPALYSQTPAGLTDEQHQRLGSMVAESAVFNKGFTGFVLFDPAAHSYLYTYRPDQYFTPASNAKIFTFFTAVTLLSEGMPAVFYEERDDTLHLWGTGYPLLFHPDFTEADTLGRWLRSQTLPIVIHDGHWRDQRFGEGWSWDDYNSGYQQEKAPLPIYGNMVRFRKTGQLGKLSLTPSLFQHQLVYEPGSRPEGPPVSRAEDRNTFYYNLKALRAPDLNRAVPFRYDLPLAADLLAEALGREVSWGRRPLPRRYQEVRIPAPDTLYRALLQDSDNFLAEQLLLMASARRYGALRADWVLAYARDTLLRKLPSPLDWVDGSGLSRYNQTTPRNLALVLDQLYHLLGPEYLFTVFPAGGRSGTIRGWYGPTRNQQPFVYAKTGTLRHVHCLSGYVRTRSGRNLIFSFMHNNFPDAVNELRREMDGVLRWVAAEL